MKQKKSVEQHENVYIHIKKIKLREGLLGIFILFCIICLMRAIYVLYHGVEVVGLENLWFYGTVSAIFALIIETGAICSYMEET